MLEKSLPFLNKFFSIVYKMHNKNIFQSKDCYKWQTFLNQNHSDNENIDFFG